MERSPPGNEQWGHASIQPSSPVCLPERGGAHLLGKSTGDTAPFQPSSPVCPPTTEDLHPEEVQKLLVPQEGPVRTTGPSSERPAIPSLLGPPPGQAPEASLAGVGATAVMLWSRLTVDLLPVQCLLHPLVASGTGQGCQPLCRVRSSELHAPPLQQQESRLSRSRDPRACLPGVPQPLATERGHCPTCLRAPVAELGSLVCKMRAFSKPRDASVQDPITVNLWPFIKSLAGLFKVISYQREVQEGGDICILPQTLMLGKTEGRRRRG